MTTEKIAYEQKTNSWLANINSGIKSALPRVGDLFVHSFGQIRILKKVYPGIMHQLIFWGVLIQIIGTAINLMQMKLFTPFELTIPRGNGYLFYEFIMDLAGVFILLGVLMAFIRRIIIRPKFLETRWDDYYSLILLTLLPIAGFFTESMRLISAQPAWAGYSFVGNALADMLKGMGVSREYAFAMHPIILLTHIGLGLLFGASLPFTKLRHLIYAPLNVLLHPRKEMGKLDKIEDIETAEVLGTGHITEFTSLQLLSFDACLNCGRCEDVCPATFSGMPYSPRSLIYNLHEAEATLAKSNGRSSYQLPEELLSEGNLWSCTTCGACLLRCPAFINPPERVIDIRRYQILTTGDMPRSVGDTLRNMERQGNPWGIPPQDRTSWTEGLEVRKLKPGDETDVLLYVGCAAAFDDRNKKVIRSFVGLLHKAGVNFGILGLDEACCGETARRMGNEYLFQVMAEQNIETFSQVKFKRIVTSCPHCYNTLKNEYPQMGGNYDVQHYTEFLNALSPSSLKISKGNGTEGRLAYHDSCYLGRYNDIYKAPRSLLDQAQVDRIEMKLHSQNSFCCGGGGGLMWLETDPNTRINHRRLQNALDVQADVVATACPYCLIMFDDAIRSKGLGDQIQVLDIAEVLEKHIE
ncbi:MAG: heterodisulfide reductase-related iron-sulfur binding cluster [Chloroflexota bacterium]